MRASVDCVCDEGCIRRPGLCGLYGDEPKSKPEDDDMERNACMRVCVSCMKEEEEASPRGGQERWSLEEEGLCGACLGEVD